MNEHSAPSRTPRALFPDDWQTIAPLLDAALERPPEERRVFVEQVCSGDAAMCTRLDALVADCERSHALLDAGAAEHFASLLVPTPVSVPPVLAGRYRIEREIGAGGMATVFLARDLQHDRNVAIKVLNPELGAILGAERFLTEIRLTANLHHPNLLPLFDSGAAEGLLYYVMPYVDGESLRARLARETQLPLTEALRIATGIASALDHAHAQGIVHRDLKPENILLQAGQPILADFGIAVAVSRAAGARVTQPGIAVGTPQYMSPEQSSGGAVDARTDIYSLGCVSYEMIAGEPPFTGATPQAVIAKHLNERPPRASIVRAGVGAVIDGALQRAMAKTPADRFASAGQFVEALATPARGTGRFRHPRTASIVGMLLLAATSAVLFASWSGRRNGQHAAALASFPVALTTLEGFETHPAISPDEKWIAFAWDRGTKTRGLYLVSSKGGTPVPLTSGDEDDTYPTWSPDGREIAFLRSHDSLSTVAIMIVPTIGGAARRVAQSASARGLDWSPDGKWLAFADRPDRESLTRVFLLSLETGERRRLTRAPGSGAALYDTDPTFSPDGRTIAFLRRPWRSGGAGDVYTQRLDDSTAVRRTTLDTYGWSVKWLDRATLLFATGTYSGRSLLEVPLAGGQLRPVAVGAGAWHVSVSRASGAVVYDEHLQDHNIWRIPGPTAPHAGRPEKLINSTRDDIMPAFSPDGTQLAFVSARSGTWELWLANADGTHERQLTDVGKIVYPTWLPNGQAILVGSVSARIPGTHSNVLVVDTSGGFPRNLTSREEQDAIPAVSPDGRWVYFQSRPDSVGWELWRTPFAGGIRERVAASPVLWAHVASNGTIYYYRPPNEIWSVPDVGGTPRLVMTAVRGPEWTVWRNDIVYLRHSDTTTTIEMLEVASGKTRTLASLPKFASMLTGRIEEDLLKSLTGLSVSPDGRWIVYSRLDRAGSDVMSTSGIR